MAKGILQLSEKAFTKGKKRGGKLLANCRFQEDKVPLQQII
jgi:hypothetical protein